ADLQIVLAAELQEALEARRGMLRPLPFIAMRQEHHEARHAQPLGLARADELVDDDLRAIGEIAELRFPQHEGVRIGKTVAIFESQHRLLRERAVDDLERRLSGTDMIDRDVALLGLLIDEDGVTLREGAAA